MLISFENQIEDAHVIKDGNIPINFEKKQTTVKIASTDSFWQPVWRNTHETKTTYLDLFFSANVDAVDVHNAFVLASSMWFTAEFQILVVVTLFKLPELGVHWFCESRLAQHEKIH